MTKVTTTAEAKELVFAAVIVVGVFLFGAAVGKREAERERPICCCEKEDGK